MRKLYTLVFVRNGRSILLGLKKRGFGLGKWNGFGGKVNESQGETILTAACRELNEECGLVVEEENLTKIGILSFEFLENPQPIMEVHVFTTATYRGEVTESDEMLPKWFSLDNIPFSEMWADDVLWFPIFLGGKKFIGDFIFRGHETIVSQNLKEVDEVS